MEILFFYFCFLVDGNFVFFLVFWSMESFYFFLFFSRWKLCFIFFSRWKFSIFLNSFLFYHIESGIFKNWVFSPTQMLLLLFVVVVVIVVVVVVVNVVVVN